LENDVLHLAVPFDEGQFRRALRPLRLWSRLQGFRGGPPADIGTLYRIARAFAERYVHERDRVAEAEVNPVRLLVSEAGIDCVALDAVVIAR
jgi:ATP-grasp domain